MDSAEKRRYRLHVEKTVGEENILNIFQDSNNSIRLFFSFYGISLPEEELERAVQVNFNTQLKKCYEKIASQDEESWRGPPVPRVQKRQCKEIFETLCSGHRGDTLPNFDNLERLKEVNLAYLGEEEKTDYAIPNIDPRKLEIIAKTNF